jgi:hypothetical protein
LLGVSRQHAGSIWSRGSVDLHPLVRNPGAADAAGRQSISASSDGATVS